MEKLMDKDRQIWVHSEPAKRVYIGVQFMYQLTEKYGR
jgi:hypothetical protein